VDMQFVLGESVKIIDGAFVGFSATIEEILSEKKKLKVMVKIFGRKTPLELGYAQVEKE
jgi:transcription termination/antitermination factor NusG